MQPTWTLGALVQSKATPAALQQTTQRLLQETTADGVLYWDARLGMPDESTIARLIELPGHMWHAGLCLGMAGLPRLMHYTRPTWMFNVDPPHHVDATSWRVSLRACLVRTDVLRHLGGIATACTSLAGASLDLGLRALTAGLLPRHIPWMLPQPPAQGAPETLPVEDEFAIARSHYPSWQVFWAGMRGAAKGALSLSQAVRHTLARSTAQIPSVKWFPPPPDSQLTLEDLRATQPRITILIPTIDRYSYLRVLLDQCRGQTLTPHEILVIDQTEAEQRDHQLAQDFADLPLRVITMDEAGQCRSRNLGLQVSTGDYIMFLDDDDEIPPNLLETHLRNLLLLRADVSSGVVYEPPQQPREVQKNRIRASDVFPTNITLLRRKSSERAACSISHSTAAPAKITIWVCASI
ncbi:MAG: glycosyltransferase family 2 protein [Chloroflexi bacterium]|nr:glycosyltransferase family 2 protein [Chloroflexota bacterium]